MRTTVKDIYTSRTQETLSRGEKTRFFFCHAWWGSRYKYRGKPLGHGGTFTQRLHVGVPVPSEVVENPQKGGEGKAWQRWNISYLPKIQGHNMVESTSLVFPGFHNASSLKKSTTGFPSQLSGLTPGLVPTRGSLPRRVMSVCSTVYLDISLPTARVGHRRGFGDIHYSWGSQCSPLATPASLFKFSRSSKPDLNSRAFDPMKDDPTNHVIETAMLSHLNTLI